MDQFREELKTPECQLIGECKYNLLRPLCERALRSFFSIMERRISGSFLCWCPEFSAFAPNRNTNKHFLRLIPFPLYTFVYAAYQWRTEWGGWVFKPPPEIPKALQNCAKLSPICENC